MIENKKNQLNAEIRSILAVMDIIDGKKEDYADYKENTLDELAYLEQQLELVLKIKNRLINIFKD